MSNGPPSRDRRSLQDLAKLASSPTGPLSSRTPTPPPASVAPISSEHDSGIVDLKTIASTDAAGAERAKTTQLASAPLFEDETPSVAPPPLSSPPSSAKLSSTAPNPKSGTKPRASAQAAVTPATRNSGGMIMPVLVGLGLAAAAAGVFVATRPPKAEPVVTTSTQATAAPVAAPAPPPSAAPSPAASAPAAAQPAPEQRIANDTPTDPASVPAAFDPAKAGGGGKRVAAAAGATKKGAVEAPSGAGGTGVSALSAMMAQSTNSPTTAPVIAPAAPGALGEAVEHAVGASGHPAAATEQAAPSAPQFAPGSVPEKPSGGAITSAIGRALPEARNCLGQDDPISKANITFSSAGTVASVVVTGSAAGKPAEACIKAALMKATVAPFAQATYAANVTVRPN